MPTESTKPTSAQILVPKCLYGDAQTTRSAWKQVVSEVRNAGSWSAVSTHTEMVLVDDYPGDVMVNPIRYRVDRGNESHWRFYWITEAVPPRPSVAGRKLFFEGMQECWYTIGSLGARNLPYLQDESHEDTAQNLWHPMLVSYIHWLPEIMSIWPRLADGLQVFMKQDNPLPRIRDLVVFSLCIHYCRPDVNVDQLDELSSTYGGDLIRAMIELKLIEPDNERYRLAI